MKPSSQVLNQIIANLSSKSSAIRYHSQFALRNFIIQEPTTVISQINRYFSTNPRIESSKLISEITVLIQNLPHDMSNLGELNSILQFVEKFCDNSNQIIFVEEIQNLSTAFFLHYPDIFYRSCDPLKKMIVTTRLAAANFLSSESDVTIIANSQLLLTFFPPNYTLNINANQIESFKNNAFIKLSLFKKYAISKLLYSLSKFRNKLPQSSKQLYHILSAEFVMFFLKSDPSIIQPFAKFFSPILAVNLQYLSDQKRSKYLHKIAKLAESNPSMSPFLINAMMDLLTKPSSEPEVLTLNQIENVELDSGNSSLFTDSSVSIDITRFSNENSLEIHFHLDSDDVNYREEDIETVFNAFIPILSIIPFHFSSELPDVTAASAYSAAVIAIISLYTFHPTIITLIINAATKSSKVEQRIGLQYCLTSMIKHSLHLNYNDISSIFNRIETPIEAGTLSELFLTCLLNNIDLMNGDLSKLFGFLENAFELSNKLSIQFVFDAASVLGKKIKEKFEENKDTLFDLISERLEAKLQFFALYFTVLDSLNEKIILEHQNLLLYLCLFKSLKPGIQLTHLEEMEPRLQSKESILAILQDMNNSAGQAEICRNILNQYYGVPALRDLACTFITYLLPNCGQEAAQTNVDECLLKLQTDFESNIDLMSSLFVSYLEVDLQAALTSFSNFIASQSKGWLFFSAPVKSEHLNNLIFKSLLKITNKTTLMQYLQFASEHLPDPKSWTEETENPAQYSLECLAKTFRQFPELNKEFPPKCRLLDFVMSMQAPNNDDVFRCVGVLLAIPPIGQVEYIPFVTKLILNSTKITDELLFMLKSTLAIIETPDDIKLIIEPFIKDLNQRIVNCQQQNSTNLNSAYDDIFQDIHYSILLSILDSLSDFSDSTENEEDSSHSEFTSLHFSIASKLNFNENVDCETLYDSFLDTMAETIGVCIPIYEKTHLAVTFILKIIERITQKVQLKTQLSLSEAVKCISSVFNSQYLMKVASLLCENQTAASVTAFILLLTERECEMLHYVQLFVSNLLNTAEPNLSIIFDANETLAKAAASLITLDNFDLLKKALKTTKHKNAIIEVLKEMLVSKALEIRKMIDDDELKSLVDTNCVEMQFVLVITDGNQSDIKKWDEDKKIAFLSLIEKYASQLLKPQLLKLAQFVSSIEETECISKTMPSFSPYFGDIDFMACFATSLHVLPILLQLNQKNEDILKCIIPISLQNEESLSLSIDYIHLIIYNIFKSEILIGRIRKQRDIYLLKRFMPLIVSTLKGQFDLTILELLSFISNKNLSAFHAPITSFVSLIQICEKLDFIQDINCMSQNCLQCIFDKAFRGIKNRNLAALVILAFLCNNKVLNSTMYSKVLNRVKELYKDPNENVQTAIITCFSCFPLDELMC